METGIRDITIIGATIGDILMTITRDTVMEDIYLMTSNTEWMHAPYFINVLVRDRNSEGQRYAGPNIHGRPAEAGPNINVRWVF